MKSASLLLSLLTVFGLADVASAQSPSQLKAELRKMEADAKKDPDAVFKAAEWAAQKGLATDAKRLYQQVLKLDKDHEGANLAVGNARFDGKWMPAKDAAAARKKAMAEEYSAKGFVEVDGVWVDKDQVEDAKRGIFHHDKERVTKQEKQAFLEGKVRHPETGQFIDAKDLERASNRYFPIGSEGRWVDEKEANTYHSDLQRPWVIRSAYCTLITTLEFARHDELKRHADRGVECVQALFGGGLPTPANRPAILIATTDEEYREMGRAFGDGTDASGAFLMREEANLRISMQGEVRPGICNFPKGLGPYFLRNASALAYANSMAADAGQDLPLWFLIGCGSLARYFENDSDAGWFGDPLAQLGGVNRLDAFFAGFKVNGDMQPAEISAIVYEAGLMLSFAMRGGNAPATAALVNITDLLSGKKNGNVAAAVQGLEKQLIGAEAAIVEYFKQLRAKAPK